MQIATANAPRLVAAVCTCVAIRLAAETLWKSFLGYGASTLIFVKQSEISLKIAELTESGCKSIKNIGRGNFDCL